MKKKQNQIDTDVLIDQLLSSVSDDEKKLIDYRMGLAAKIIAGIRAKGWSRTEFAKQMKIKNNSVITKWLSGNNNFETDTLFQIEQVLEIKLLNLDDEKDVRYKNKVSAPYLPPVDFEGGKIVDIKSHFSSSNTQSTEWAKITK